MGPAESNVGPRQTASANANVIEALSALEARQAWMGPRGLRLTAVLIALVVFYSV